MALVLGTNCGFVEEAPVDDPAANTSILDGRAWAVKDTASANAKVIEIGVWINNNSEESNIEIGIYEDDNGSPGNLLGKTNFAKGTTSGWKSGVIDISITNNEIYWIAVQLDNVTTTTNSDNVYYGAGISEYRTSQTELTDPWETEETSANIRAIYAVWGVGGETHNLSYSDTTTLSDSVSIGADVFLGISNADVTTLSDTISVDGLYLELISETDTTTLTDSVTLDAMTYTPVVIPLETLTLSDTFSRSVNLSLGYIDTSPLSDSLSINFLLNHSELDTSNLSDSVSLNLITQFSKIETLTLSDTAYIGADISLGITKTETITLSDTTYIDGRQTLGTSQSSTLTLTDTVSIIATKIYPISETDTLTITDTFLISRIIGIPVSTIKGYDYDKLGYQSKVLLPTNKLRKVMRWER